jgi:hypothetical protein
MHDDPPHNARSHDDPKTIADYLIQEHGLDGALDGAIQGAIGAQNEGDYYALSVWREIKSVVRARLAARAAENKGDSPDLRALRS